MGDYILSGGEPAVMAMLDAALRLLPGVLDNDNTIRTESFELTTENEDIEGQLLEYPLYTKPNIWRGREVPAVLLSGDHQKIAAWQQQQAIDLTKRLRPDLLKYKH